MRMQPWLIPVLVGLVVGSTVQAQLDGAVGTPYVVQGGSTLQEGCFAPCLCPILALYLGGTFLLTPTGVQDGFETFSVDRLEWIAFVGSPVQTITGSGSYRTDAELQQLVLDLQIDGGPVERYDSGLVPVGVEFPAIDVLASVGNLFCYDEAVDLVAAPLDESGLRLSAPSPTLLHWTVHPEAASYDVVYGDLDYLRRSGGDFTTATEPCLAEGLETPALSYYLPLEPGEAIWFLVRGLPVVTYESGSPYQYEPRDPQIERSPVACH